MPIYNFVCEKCHNTTRRLLKPGQLKGLVPVCTECGDVMIRKMGGPSVRITETLDNGTMTRKLERLADAEQIHDEMAHGKKGVI
jgi:NAD-dependent SIR2 family protein deacetylase